jgi:hypothetical protein
MTSIQSILLANYNRFKNNKEYINKLKLHLICPNCRRLAPNDTWWFKKGCIWCIQR